MNMERHKPNPRQHHFLLSKGCSYVAHLKNSSLRILLHVSVNNTDLRSLCFTASCFQKRRKLGRYVVGKMTAWCWGPAFPLRPCSFGPSSLAAYPCCNLHTHKHLFNCILANLKRHTDTMFLDICCTNGA